MACNVQCVPVSSHWVRQFILTASCELAVWFKNGVCCLYPHTTQAWFQQAIAAPSPGKYIHAYLYKIMPYRLIRPPCPPSGGITTPCCPNSLPATLHATGNLGLGSVALAWDGVRYWTSSAAPLSCGASVALRFQCASGGVDCSGFALDYTCDGGTTWVPAIVGGLSCTCSPLSIPFSGNVGLTEHCQPCNDTLNLTVTT